VRAQAAITIVRDVVLMLVGSFIAINEELTGHVHPELLVLAAALLGVPSTVALLQLSRGKPEIPVTPESSQSSHSPLPPPS
jgi:hypothetical protein